MIEYLFIPKAIPDKAELLKYVLKYNERFFVEEEGMRAIKFRAWDKNLRVMANYMSVGKYGDFYKTTSFNDLYCDDGRPDLEVMQYTGLKDSNNIEIYEGDILLDISTSTLTEVFFYEGCFCLKSPDYYPCLNECQLSNCDVVGNIYENPELIDGNPAGKSLAGESTHRHEQIQHVSQEKDKRTWDLNPDS